MKTKEETQTWKDLVRKHIPEADDQECEYILWEQTCFPCGNKEDVERQVIEYAKRKK